MPRRLSTFQFHSQAHTKHVVLLSASFLNLAHEKKRSKAENDRKNQDIQRFWGKISSFTLTCPSDRPCRPFPYHKLRLADRGVVAIGGFWHSDGSGGGAYRSSFYSLSRLRERGAKSQAREGCHSMGCLRAANTSSTNHLPSRRLLQAQNGLKPAYLLGIRFTFHLCMLLQRTMQSFL